MDRCIQAIANCKFFAAGKDRAIATKAKANASAYAGLHAHLTHVLSTWRGSLRGLLRTASTRLQRSERTSALCPCRPSMQPIGSAVRQPSPRLIVVG